MLANVLTIKPASRLTLCAGVNTAAEKYALKIAMSGRRRAFPPSL
jgi:hypothetical protein